MTIFKIDKSIKKLDLSDIELKELTYEPNINDIYYNDNVKTLKLPTSLQKLTYNTNSLKSLKL